MQPLGEAKRTYLAIIVLFGTAFVALPRILTFDFEVQAMRGLVSFGSNFQAVSEISEIASFLMSPCLFFAALYFYGKRTARHFSESYLSAALSLFLGSCVGFTIFALSTPMIEGIPLSLSLFYSFDFGFDIITVGAQTVLIGVGALALSCLRAEPSTTIPEGLPESPIQRSL